MTMMHSTVCVVRGSINKACLNVTIIEEPSSVNDINNNVENVFCQVFGGMIFVGFSRARNLISFLMDDKMALDKE